MKGYDSWGRALDAPPARVERATADRSLDSDLPVLAYEVWSPLPANAHLDIADVAERKWRAIAAHESQTRSTDYLAAQQALGRYRAICAGRPGPCEAFHRTDLRGYAAIARSLEV